mgnify:CR=1 FL=1
MYRLFCDKNKGWPGRIDSIKPYFKGRTCKMAEDLEKTRSSKQQSRCGSTIVQIILWFNPKKWFRRSTNQTLSPKIKKTLLFIYIDDISSARQITHNQIFTCKESVSTIEKLRFLLFLCSLLSHITLELYERMIVLSHARIRTRKVSSFYLNSHWPLSFPSLL